MILDKRRNVILFWLSGAALIIVSFFIRSERPRSIKDLVFIGFTLVLLAYAYFKNQKKKNL